MARSPFKSANIKGVAKAFSIDGKSLPEAAVKGLGNAVIISKIDGYIGSPLQRLPSFGSQGGNGLLSNILGKLPLKISATTVINYFVLNKFKLSVNFYAILGSLIAVAAGVNPVGSISTYNKQQPYIVKADRGMRGL